MKKVMVVDDEMDIRFLASAILRNHDYSVVTAEDAPEALSIAGIEHPDLILLDVYMPSSDGWDVLIKLKQNAQTKNIPVVMLTAADTIKSMDLAFDLGAKDYLTKPVEPEKLLSKVAQYLS